MSGQGFTKHRYYLLPQPQITETGIHV
jgi:hypothetical protein